MIGFGLSGFKPIGYISLKDKYQEFQIQQNDCSKESRISISFNKIIETTTNNNFEGLPNNSNVISWFLCDESRYRLVDGNYQLIDLDGNDIDGAIINIEYDTLGFMNIWNISTSIPFLDNTLNTYLDRVVGYTDKDIAMLSNLYEIDEVNLDVIGRIFYLFSELKSKGINITHYNLTKNNIGVEESDNLLRIYDLSYAYVEGISVVDRSLSDDLGYSTNYPLYDLHSLIRNEIIESENIDNIHQLIYLFSMFCGSYDEAQEMLMDINYLPYQEQAVKVDARDIAFCCFRYTGSSNVELSDLVYKKYGISFIDNIPYKKDRLPHKKEIEVIEMVIHNYRTEYSTLIYDDIVDLVYSNNYADITYIAFFFVLLGTENTYTEIQKYAIDNIVNALMNEESLVFEEVSEQEYSHRVLVSLILSKTSTQIITYFPLRYMGKHYIVSRKINTLKDLLNEGFNLEDVIQQIICLLYQLYVEYGFVHYQLNLDNIGIEETEQEWIEYNIGIKYVYVPTNGYKVYFAGFSYSHIYHNGLHYGRATELDPEFRDGIHPHIVDIKTLFRESEVLGTWKEIDISDANLINLIHEARKIPSTSLESLCFDSYPYINKMLLLDVKEDYTESDSLLDEIVKRDIISNVYIYLVFAGKYTNLVVETSNMLDYLNDIIDVDNKEIVTEIIEKIEQEQDNILDELEQSTDLTQSIYLSSSILSPTLQELPYWEESQEFVEDIRSEIEKYNIDKSTVDIWIRSISQLNTETQKDILRELRLNVTNKDGVSYFISSTLNKNINRKLGRTRYAPNLITKEIEKQSERIKPRTPIIPQSSSKFVPTELQDPIKVIQMKEELTREQKMSEILKIFEGKVSDDIYNKYVEELLKLNDENFKSHYSTIKSLIDIYKEETPENLAEMFINLADVRNKQQSKQIDLTSGPIDLTKSGTFNLSDFSQ